MESDRPLDDHNLTGIFRLQGDKLVEEFDAFLAKLRPVVDQMYAEYLLRPLEKGCFELAKVPHTALAKIFSLPLLITIFPLVPYGLDWTTDKTTGLA